MLSGSAENLYVDRTKAPKPLSEVFFEKVLKNLKLFRGENMQPLISIIVPIYKVEPYLRKCIDSILNQTHKNLEVILVDDGSPDNCGTICDEYAAQDNRVRVIHKANGGLSSARNAGLDVMTGAYVGFVDSDDWIEPNMYQKLLELMEQYDAQMAIGGVADEMQCGEYLTTVKTSDYRHTPLILDKIAAMTRLFQGPWPVWDKLYQADLLKEIRFPVGEINEDEAIAVHLLEQCQRVCYTNEIFYHYLHRPESITSTSFHARKLVWVRHCHDNLRYIETAHPELAPYALERYRGSLLWALRELSILGQGLDEAWLQMRRELRSLFPGVSVKKLVRMVLLAYFPRKWLNILFTRRMNRK